MLEYSYTPDQKNTVSTTPVHIDESSLVCLYLNAGSLMNSEFQATVCNLQPDVIGVTESWSTESVLDSELELDGYSLGMTDLSKNALYQNNMATCNCVPAQDRLS